MTSNYMDMNQKVESNLSNRLSLILLQSTKEVLVEWNGVLNGQLDTVNSKKIKELSCVLASSRYLQQQIKAYPAEALEALTNGVESLVYSKSEYSAELAVAGVCELDEASLMKKLRQFRHKHMMLIAWRDQVGADVSDTLISLSVLADALISLVCDDAYAINCKRYGVPKDSLGTTQQLMIIGMGKLGANELNFSSDIDLIFCYPSAGETGGSRSISNDEFFTRQCRLIVKLLDQQTANGFVFRVDTRLRPFGNSGSLALNLDAMELYYQSHAREWERYAMVKARLITGDDEGKKNLQSMIKAFVYRRYLDYGVFDSIRVMKREIEAQLKRKGVENNIKLGPGGIREIEFIGQAYQLIHGGRDKSLQERSIVKILSLLADKGHIVEQAAKELTEDYFYLRRLENYIQEIDDKQTHELPANELEQARLVLAMKVDDWEELLDKTHQVMARVHGFFESLVDFSPAISTSNDIDWLGLDAVKLTEYLKSKNIVASESVRRDIVDFCQSYPVRQLQEKGRKYFVRLMPMLIEVLLLDDGCEQTLSAFLKMLEKICNRTVYLVLLVENKSVFEQLIRLAKLSPLIISQVTKAPILLDELIDPSSLYHPPVKKDLEIELDNALAGLKQDDIERQMEEIRLFKQVNVLRVAAADLTGVIPLMVVSDKLTDIAEVIVDKVLALCWKAVCTQYGAPIGASVDAVTGFAVIGFGKMGGIELGFSSDLDIVFLHKDVEIDEMTLSDNAISLPEFYMRLGRKIITFMTTKTFSGQLYEMDLRLRPNGNSGLLVTSESSFEIYQKSKAWTWEHQALIRARFVAGCSKMGEVFDVIRTDVLAMPRDVETLRHDVLEMREKMRSALLKAKVGYFDLKHGVGGIVDIEFIVQFGVLANTGKSKSLLTYTDNVRLLLALNKVGFLSDGQQQGLSEAYKTYREASHHASLAETSTMVEQSLIEKHVQLVSAIWANIILNN